MTRPELARMLRNTANTLWLPLADGTDLSRSERKAINRQMEKLSGLAESVEASNTADANAD